jgi:hypothetical protein
MWVVKYFSDPFCGSQRNLLEFKFQKDAELFMYLK